jgi:hypothetical protein
MLNTLHQYAHLLKEIRYHFKGMYGDINTGWSRDQIRKSPKGFMENLITYQPVFISHTLNDTL